jgi:hypothetical protein
MTPGQQAIERLRRVRSGDRPEIVYQRSQWRELYDADNETVAGVVLGPSRLEKSQAETSDER